MGVTLREDNHISCDKLRDRFTMQLDETFTFRNQVENHNPRRVAREGAPQNPRSAIHNTTGQ